MKIICHVNDIGEGESKGFAIGERNIFAVKRDNTLYFYENRCPHLGVELEWVEDQFLNADGMLIQCATHGALFIIETGECVAGPCLGGQLQNVNVEICDDVVHLLD